MLDEPFGACLRKADSARMNFGFWILTQVLYFLLRLAGCCHGYTHEVCLDLSVLLESRLNLSFFLSLTSVAFEVSNPSGKNQHGIKKCMALNLLVFLSY